MMLPTAPLERFLRARTGARAARLTRLSKLSGGAIQENWRMDVRLDRADGPEDISTVLRTDAPSALGVSHGRAAEFHLLRAAYRAGVTVPEPLWLEEDTACIGRPFFVMRRVGGTAAPHRIIRSETAGGGREALAQTLGAELARIHAIRPGADLAFLDPPASSPALDRVAEFRAALDASNRPQPVLEWGARWLEINAPPPPAAPVLCHNDFRTGNLMVDDAGVTGVLDWEFAGWGDRHADLGWFCAPCWRFGSAHEAGGIGPRQAFYRGYEATSGQVIDRAVVAYWEVLATVRWAVIAVGQGDRHLSGREASLELALTRHVVPALELDILAMTGVAGHA